MPEEKNETRTIEVELEEKPEDELRSFHDVAISGEHGDYEYELLSGLGLGSSMFWLVLHKDGEKVKEEKLDVSDLFKGWLDQVISEHEEEES